MLESSKVVLTFESIDEILRRDHSNKMKPLWQFFHEVLFVFHYFTKRNLEILSDFNFGHFWLLKAKSKCNHSVAAKLLSSRC